MAKYDIKIFFYSSYSFLLNRVLLEPKVLLALVVKKEREGPLVNLDLQALEGLQA